MDATRDAVAALLAEGKEAAWTGQIAEARSKYRAALGLDPGSVSALLWLAYLDFDPPASLAYVMRAQRSEPHNPRVHRALAWARQRAAASAVPEDGSADAPPPAGTT